MKKNPIFYLFFIFLICITFLDIASEKKSFSALENRNLAKRPKFSLKSFMEGEYIKGYEEYINDNFLFRDGWISLKALSEDFLGKKENNNIIYGKEGYMFEKTLSYKEDRFKNNIDSLNKFIDSYKGRVTTFMVPNSYTIYKEYLPFGLELLDQEKLIEEVYKGSKKDLNIDLVKLFKENKKDYIYYKTDHHWTTYGAYLGYSSYINLLGEKEINLKSLKENKIDNFYGTYFSKSKNVFSKGDFLTYYDINNISMNIYEEEFNSLYDYEKLEERDKYSFFLRGNNGLTLIKNNNIKEDKKLLIFKDSFANSMIPFLAMHFKEIHVIDLRSFKLKVSDYIKDKNFQEVLILYNIENFFNDINVVKIKY